MITRATWCSLLLLAATLTGCGSYDKCAERPTDGDPFEACDPFRPVNEQIFAFNVFVDRWAIGPITHVYQVVPIEGRATISNFLSNLGEPMQVANGLLQGNFQGAGTSLFRFILNSTFGFAGLRDFAGENGIKDQDQNFGKTLASYGVDQGPYIVAPIIGPATSRSAVGGITEWVADPVGFFLTPAAGYIQAGADGLVARDENDAIINQYYYESLEPYAATRAAYLQHSFHADGEN